MADETPTSSTGKQNLSGGKFLLIVAAVLIAFWAVRFAMNPFSLCGNQIHDEIHSADAELRAVIFQRDCGATTGFSTQISILGEDERLPNRGGDVLVIDGHPRNVAPRIEWFGSDTLLVHRALDGSEYKAEESWGHSGRIEIVYDEN